MPAEAYPPDYFASKVEGSQRSAASVIREVRALIGNVESVLDVGCGTGAWLFEWQASGAQTVLGLDGDYVNREDLLIDSRDFIPIDLTGSFPPLSLNQFDLTMSVEVAEHLPEAAADKYVQLLCAYSDAVLFSAAVPGQGGKHHVNEQWPEYWRDRFGRHGFEMFDLLRERVWADESVEWWYRQNMFVFARGAVADLLARHVPSTMPLRVVHPDLFSREHARRRRAVRERDQELERRRKPPLLKDLVRWTPAAVRNAVRHRLRAAADELRGRWRKR